MQAKLTILLVLFVFQFGHAQLSGEDHEAWEYALEDSGDILQIALPATALLATLLNEDYEGTKELAYSYGSTIILTHTLKYLIHKQRPEGRERYDSFPSGHTSSAFAGAAFIQKRYGWRYGIPSYVLATLVGVSRLEGPNGYHDVWDVIAGASIGIGFNALFTSNHQKDHWRISFKANQHYKTIGVSFQF